jgi:hypothetical protein
MTTPNPETSRALLNSVDYGPCWLWQGTTNGVGYGQISVNGRHQYVHRAVYTELRGPIPPGLVLDHTCGQTLCFRPDHLEPVTQQVNVLRAVRDPRTKCRHGHDWTPANTYIVPTTGARQCRVCNKLRERARRLRVFGIGQG